MLSHRIWPSTFYFLFFAAIAAVFPFLALYYQSLGFSGRQVGLLLSISPLITLFASPLLTGLADASQRHKTLLVISIFSGVVVMAFFPTIHSFVLIFLAMVIFAFSSAPIIALVDSATLSMLGSQRNMYGRIRFWGTIGWGISAPIAGVVLQQNGLRWMFWIYAVLMVMNLITVRYLNFVQSISVKPFLHGVHTVLTERRWVLFLLMVFVTAIGVSVHTNFLSVLMDSMGASKTLMGIALTVSTISELPIMFFSNILLRKIKANGLLSLAMAVAGLRCVLYYFASGSQAVLAIQLLHGLTFPALWIAGVTYAAENAPAGLSATAQGLFSSILMGFGAAAGSLFGGVLIDQFGIAGMYGTTGLIVIISLLLFLIIQRRSIAM